MPTLRQIRERLEEGYDQFGERPDTVDVIRRLRAEQGPAPEPIPAQPDPSFFQSVPDYDWTQGGGLVVKDEGGRGLLMNPEDRPEPGPLEWNPAYEEEFQEMLARNPLPYHRPTYAPSTNYDEFARKQFLGGKQREADERRENEEWNRTFNKERIAPWMESQERMRDLSFARTANELILGQLEREGKALKQERLEESTRPVKGTGAWNRIIGPPGVQTKPQKSPFPGPPPPEEDLTDLREFDKFWNFRVQKAYGGQDPLKINPVDARLEAEEQIKKENEQFLYDYEIYDYFQKDPAATKKYKKLTDDIKRAGDLAAKRAEEVRNMAKDDYKTTLDFFNAHRKELSEKGKMSKEDQQELISIRQEKNALRRDAKDIYLDDEIKKESADKLKRLEARENELLAKKAGARSTQPSRKQRPITEGLRYMKGITDRDELIKRARILKDQYGWTHEELSRLSKELGL